MSWNDPNVTEQQLIQESEIEHPGAGGGVKSVTLQRAGYLRRLRAYLDMTVAQSAATGAPSKSAWGPFAAAIRRFRVEASGKVPLLSLSGLGAQIYNEIQNRDASVMAPPVVDSELNVTLAKKLIEYTAPTTGVVNYEVRYPIEALFSLPVFVQGIATEFGLWLLQNQAIEVTVEADFYPAIDAAAANPERLYSGGTGLVATVAADSQIKLERELYAVPARPEDRPDQTFAHQVIEYKQPIQGGFARFNIPQSGLLLRAILITLDANDALVEWDDISDVAFIYGSNETPIKRPGWSLVQEMLQDYGRYPQKGAVSLDFYKWGLDTMKLVRNTEVLSNLRIETNYAALTTGEQRVILDTLVPINRAA